MAYMGLFRCYTTALDKDVYDQKSINNQYRCLLFRRDMQDFYLGFSENFEIFSIISPLACVSVGRLIGMYLSLCLCPSLPSPFYVCV